ncbi:MAG: MFS transporter [Chloroflexota bacterium]
MSTQNRKVFYGWWIVGAGFFIAAYIGGFIHFGFTAIFEPIANDLGWSHAQVSFAASIRGLEMGLFTPVVGFLVDRWGPRKLIITGTAIIGLGLLALSQISSLISFYGAFVLTALGISLCVGVVPLTAVNLWFRKKATAATGVLVSGVAAGGLLVPLATLLIDTLGWRTAMASIGCGAFVILLPLALLFRNRPEQYGYQVDGDSSEELAEGESRSSSQSPELDIGVRQALKSRTFWHLAIGYMCHILVINAVITHVMPYLSSIDITRSVSSLVASAIPITSVVGRLSFGYLGDRFDKKRVTALGFAMSSLGLLLFGCSSMLSTWMLLPFLVLIGIGYGGPVPMIPSLVRQYFGRVHFGTVLGIVMAGAALGGIIGPPIAGWVFDKFGSYQNVWFAFAGLLLTGMISLLTTPSVAKKG